MIYRFCTDFIFYNLISRKIHGIDVLVKYPVFFRFYRSICLNCLNAHISERICADSVVVITRRCQRLNPGSSPGRRTLSFFMEFLLFIHRVFSYSAKV